MFVGRGFGATIRTAPLLRLSQASAWRQDAHAQVQKEEKLIDEIGKNAQQHQLIEQEYDPLHYAVVQRSLHQPSDEPEKYNSSDYRARMMGEKLNSFDVDPFRDVDEHLLRADRVFDDMTFRFLGTVRSKSVEATHTAPSRRRCPIAPALGGGC